MPLAFWLCSVYPMYVCNRVGPNNFFVVRLSFYLHHLFFSLISKYGNITNWKYKVYFSNIALEYDGTVFSDVEDL